MVDDHIRGVAHGNFDDDDVDIHLDKRAKSGNYLSPLSQADLHERGVANPASMFWAKPLKSGSHTQP